MAVHDVDMDPVRAGGVDRAHFLAKPREIGGEDGGSDADGLHAPSLTLRDSAGKEAADLSPA